MFSPIALQEFDELKYRAYVQTLSDDALIEEGKQLRVLCGNVATPIVSAFDQQQEVPCRWLNPTTVFAKQFPSMMNRATIPLPCIAASATDGFATSMPRMKNGIPAS